MILRPSGTENIIYYKILSLFRYGCLSQPGSNCILFSTLAVCTTTVCIDTEFRIGYGIPTGSLIFSNQQSAMMKTDAGTCASLSVSLLTKAGVKCEVRGVRCEVVKCEVLVRGINARRWVICEAGMCEAQRTTGTKGVVVGCETLKRN